jgi:hypothetical protein
MPMEQETMGMLNGGFSVIMGIAFIVVLVLMLSKKRQPLSVANAFVIGFLVFFTCAISHALKAISFDINHPMASEEISLSLGFAGVLWAISMLFLLVGIIKFSSTQKSTVKTK